MNQFFFSLLLVCISQIGWSQAQLSSALQSQMSQRGNLQLTVLVEGYQLDWQYLESLKVYDNKHQNRLAVLQALRNHAQQEQQWVNQIKGVEVVHQFWASNAVACKVSKKDLEKIMHNPNVLAIQLLHETKMQLTEPEVGGSRSGQSVNGVEPGITAVKAPFLWDLGYSGKNTKLLTFDTGIWPNHPALRNQFLGKRGPLDHAWYGYDTHFPGDKVNSHGTHVTGTSMGLDPVTNDTIGIAFNAYVMATDPIVSSLSDLKGTYEIMRAYEWALNPDGDTNTTHDMPDVINNSWGRPVDTLDSVMCHGWVNDLLVNLEVLDIISIHSAGNNGPGAATLSFPGSSNASEVNSFTVGAVNAASSNWPIAGFSSRGPSTCPGTGSLLIKPEVVAPGVAVRSSVRDANNDYTYDAYQGTSMASPHVSGVALLLVEAFPMANATEIKEALYYSAVDLGAPGEDNDYGNGMIDSEAAFNYLATLYTPSTVSSNTFDIDVVNLSITNKQKVCDLAELKVYFHNQQPVPLAIISLEFGAVGGTPQYLNFTTGTLQTNDSVTLTINASAFNGWENLYCKAIYTGSNMEIDTINNAYYVSAFFPETATLPFLENFEQSGVFNGNSFVNNPDERTTFSDFKVAKDADSTQVARMRWFEYAPRNQQHDGLELPGIAVSGNSLQLTFDVSYQLRFEGFTDSLMVLVSTTCDAASADTVYAKGPEELSLDNNRLGTAWEPTLSTHWRTDSVDLSAYTNENFVYISFVTSNGQGNNLYLDNINVFNENGPISVGEVVASELFVYPNPVTNGQLRLSENVTGAVFSVTGKQVMQLNQSNSISIVGLPNGVYVLRLTDSGKAVKFVVQNQ